MEQHLLKAILATLGRIAFPEEVIFEIVAPSGPGEKQLAAYNLCDGSHTQAEIARITGFDRGNLSRTLNRWIEKGIVFKDDDGNPVHLYPISN